MTITENIARIQGAVEKAVLKAGTSHHVNLIAVTKYVDVSLTSQLIDAGMTHLGENRVDQFLDKYGQLKDKPVTWHFIGTLQRRKVKDVINYVDYFHALDSVKLAQEIQKRAVKPIKCFLQVNISGEESKHGFSLDELESALSLLSQLDKVILVGLMTMAPFDATDNELNAIFKRANELRERIAEKNYSNMPMTELSMGMSRDFPIAIANGATFVRIGSAFFE